jgi:hypothetical protein
MEIIKQLYEQSAELDTHKHDHIAYASQLKFDDNAELHVPTTLMGNLPPLKPTDWAWGQLFSKLGPTVYGRGSQKTLPSDYLLAIPRDLLATNLNRHLLNANKQWMVRAYDNHVRAVLDSKYPTIQNTELLQIIDAMLDDNAAGFPDLKVVRPDVTPDDLNIKTVWKDISGRNYGIGVYVGNGEIGNRKLRCLPMIQRHSCTNSIIFDGENGLEMVHRGSSATMRVQLKAAFVNIFHTSFELAEAMIRAEEERIPEFADVIKGLSIQYGWSDDVTASVLIGTENQQTRAGIVNGISWAAHEAVQDANDQTDLEVLAGRILVAPNSLFGRMVHVANSK